MHASFVKSARNAILLHAVPAKEAGAWTRKLPFLKSVGFSGKDGELRLVPGRGGISGGVSAWVLGLGKSRDPLALAAFSESLPDGVYRLGEVPEFCAGAQGALAWRLGLYSFDRYKKPKARHLKLVLPKGVDEEDVSRIADGVFLARDLVNTPPNDMGPAELQEAARQVAAAHGAKFRVVEGRALVRDYPLVGAVGQGSARGPRLIEFSWGDPKAPKVTLVGKGVCFDTGGYNLKNTPGMATMKKDMGGAAVVLGLSQMVMDAKLNMRLRVLIPAVENSVSGSAYRPSDVFKSRKGLTVEIGNTDAEGRLILADALAAADEDTPDLLIDCATLTGAARMATGMELPPFFTDDENLAADLSRHAAQVADPMWRLPLWRGYESALESKVADITNNPNYNLAGAITAALFLNRFVGRAKSWLHIDIPAWVDRPKPGRRLGAEANGARALYALMKARYGR